MAKRDKLYTVNKWNRPFFEEERRKRLYGYGSQIINGLGGLDINGYGKMPINTKPVVNKPGWISDTELISNPWRNMATVYAAPSEENSTPSGDSNQQDVANTSNNSKLRMIQDAAIAARDFAEGFKPITKLANLNESITKPTPVTSTSSTGLFSNTGFGPKTTVFTETPYTTNTSTVFSNVLNPRSLSQNVISPKTTSYVLNGADGFANANNNFQKVIGSYLQTNPQSDFAKYLTLDDMANSKIALPSLIEGYTPKIKGSGISDLGKAGIGIGASVLGEVGGNVISDGFSTTPGTLINLIGSTAGSVVSMIPGVGWWVGPAITLGSKLLGGVYNRAFGSEYKDNGASAYTNRLNALNPNGSNEYLANLLANTGSGPRATSRNGWFNHSAERKANRTNTAQDLAFDRFRRGIKNAFDNNNWKQLQYALNDNITAMGGKLKKCNCKAMGGVLNNVALDSASPTGFNFLSNLTNMLEMKNQSNQDMGSSVGNSFMATPDMGTLFASGGPINIKKSHRGRLTELKKRTGKTEAELYNDGNPAHRKMVTFARNARKWKKAYGGFLDAANNLSEIEKTLYGNGGILETKDKDYRNNSFFDEPTLFALGGIYQAAGANWGNVSEINEGGTHEENPNEGVQVGVDPEGTPNLVEEGEVIWNDYVFSDRIECPKEVCKLLRVGVKKNGFTFAEVAKKLLKESKERPNDPISKRGLEANMEKLEGYQEEVKQKMEAEQAVEQFNSLPPEQQVAIMQQEGQKAQDAVTQQQMAQELQNLPPEQQQAIAQQMAMEQAQAQGMPPQGMPQQGPSPEEQAMMQQQMAQLQYAPQGGINPQEALAQAAAMQQQAINGSAYGGRLFADGGMLPQEEVVPAEEEQYQQEEQPVEQADPEMAKYSDEELQEIINDYEEVANGEKKVTKGRLARLKKKAERAERELERRNSQGENAEQEQPSAAEGQPQEPTQEQVQAAAQVQAQQQMMEGQPQGGVPLEGISPEQAMMMQQQMGGEQMSPEQMAAMELQQQGNGQYAYGGHLYPEGGKLRGIDLLSLLGYPSYQDAEEAGFNDPKMFGLNSWEDYINPETFKWNSKWLDYKGISPELKYAIQNNLYNPAQLLLSQNNAPWFEDTNGPGLYNWSQFHGKGKIEGDDKIPEHEFDVLQAAFPHTLGNLSWSSDLTFDMVDKAMKNSDDWKRTLKYLFDEKEGSKRRADYMSRIVRHNLNDTDDGINPNFRATEIYDFTQDNNGNWVATRKADKTEQDEINFWKDVQSDYKYGDMYNTFHLPEQKIRYFVSDGKGGYKEYFNKPTGLKQIGSDLSSYIYGDGEESGKLNGSGYNQTIKFYNKPNDDSNGSDESKYLTVGWKPKTNYTDYVFGALPGLTGLGMMLGRGAPDMSGLDAAVAAYERNTGNMIAPHLTHGLIRPAIIDPRVTENNLNARRLGTNRLLMNTGSTPSRGATILANDANTISQLGQAMINNWKENRAQEQAAANFNRETATTNANILNQVDQFNAQTKASMANIAAQMRYNAAKDKIAARDAYYQGLLGNMGSIFTGINEARKQQNINNQRDLLLASGVFGETNPFLENYYGISKVDPETGEVKRGYNTGMYYWQNPQTGKFEYLNTKPPKPSLATPSLHSKGGKVKKNKKRRGYTF